MDPDDFMVADMGNFIIPPSFRSMPFLPPVPMMGDILRDMAPYRTYQPPSTRFDPRMQFDGDHFDARPWFVPFRSGPPPEPNPPAIFDDTVPALPADIG